jgi:hypothetical protein
MFIPTELHIIWLYIVTGKFSSNASALSFETLKEGLLIRPEKRSKARCSVLVMSAWDVMVSLLTDMTDTEVAAFI